VGSGENDCANGFLWAVISERKKDMDGAAAETLLRSFNACISRRDVGGLSMLMTDDHVFIDTAGARVTGKEACLEAWRGFFAAFPDYRNVFERMRIVGDHVAIAGHSSCSDPRLDGSALWSAKLRGSQLCEWRVYDDTDANRERLGLA
jgi:ketosteroid isomerase-like protein